MSARIIQVRPSRNQRWQKQAGWDVYEGDGVCPVYVGPTAREYAMSYAQQRAGYAPTEVRVLGSEWNVIEIIPAQKHSWTRVIVPLLLLKNTPTFP